MKKILVTGSNGMLGQDLCPVLEKNGFEVIRTNRETMDITNFEKVESVILDVNPDIVIHCAAYTNVDKAETDFEKAKLINSSVTENIAKICAKKNITIVYISTDYVFDGEKSEPYRPADFPNPINNYGLTKLEGEKSIQKYCSKYYICRTSWLYGIHGKNFVETMISLSNNSELKVVDDQIGCPTWTVDLSNAIVKIIKEKPYGIYHTCGGGQTSWYDFAKKIFELCETNVIIKPCTTEEFPRPAKRPKYSVMDSDKICRPWREALADYLKLYHL